MRILPAVMLRRDKSIYLHRLIAIRAVVMLYLSLILLLSGAAVGAYFAYLHLTGRPPDTKTALIHGPIAYSGVLVLLYYMWLNGPSVPGATAAVILTLGALGGAFMYLGHKNGRALPPLLIAGHMLLGVTGVLFVAHLANIF